MSVFFFMGAIGVILPGAMLGAQADHRQHSRRAEVGDGGTDCTASWSGGGACDALDSQRLGFNSLNHTLTISFFIQEVDH